VQNFTTDIFTKKQTFLDKKILNMTRQMAPQHLAKQEPSRAGGNSADARL